MTGISICMHFAQMLPVFAATGHNSYAKSGVLILQMTYELPDKHDLLYKQFVFNRCYSVRGHKLWSGLPTDLAIEQVMMKELKSRGGLTHGRGLITVLD